MICFYYEAKTLEAKTEEGLAEALSFPLIKDAPDTVWLWKVPYEAYHTIITHHSSCSFQLPSLETMQGSDSKWST